MQTQQPRPASFELRRLHEITQTIAFSALRYDPAPIVDLDPVDQDDDDQEREQ